MKVNKITIWVIAILILSLLTGLTLTIIQQNKDLLSTTNELLSTKAELEVANLNYENLLSSIPEYDDKDIIMEDKFNGIFEVLTNNDGIFTVDVDGTYSFKNTVGEIFSATIHFHKGDNINDLIQNFSK